LINAQATPDEQKDQKERQLRRSDSLVEKPGAAGKQEHRRRADTPLLQHDQQGVFLFVLQRNAERQPERVEKPGDSPKTEVSAFGVAVQVEENADQHADTEEGGN